MHASADRGQVAAGLAGRTYVPVAAADRVERDQALGVRPCAGRWAGPALEERQRGILREPEAEAIGGDEPDELVRNRSSVLLDEAHVQRRRGGDGPLDVALFAGLERERLDAPGDRPVLDHDRCPERDPGGKPGERARTAIVAAVGPALAPVRGLPGQAAALAA